MAVTTEMECNTIGALRKMGVQVVVAPYEADSQLAYLCKSNVCQAVLTEDSDVIVYSMACEKPFPILFKFDKKSNRVEKLDCAGLFDIAVKGEVLSRLNEEKGQSSYSTNVSNVGEMHGAKVRRRARGVTLRQRRRNLSCPP